MGVSDPGAIHPPKNRLRSPAGWKFVLSDFFSLSPILAPVPETHDDTFRLSFSIDSRSEFVHPKSKKAEIYVAP